MSMFFKFSELDAEAKEKAREWWREASAHDNFFAEYVIDDAVACAAILGIEIARRKARGAGSAVYWSGFYSQGDGASFEGAYSYVKGAAKAIRKHAPTDTELHRIADALQAAQRVNFYRLTAGIEQSGHYCHEMTMKVDVERSDGVDVTAGADETVAECMRDFARWIYRQLKHAYEYENSDAQVDETIEANEYTFDEYGNRA